MRRPTLVLADDHAVLLDALSRLLSTHFDVVGTAADGHDLIRKAQALTPDIVVVDVAMPHLNGLDACEQLRQLVPRSKLVVLTMNEDPDVAAEAVRRGASGYLLKTAAAAELVAAIGDVLDGRTYITPSLTSEPSGVFVERARKGRSAALTMRQREVLQLLAEGKSMKEAAAILDVSARTIAFHKYTIMEQLGLKTSAELVQHAISLGLIASRR